MAFFKITNKVISKIDAFYDAIDLGGIVFKEALTNFMTKHDDMFKNNISSLQKLENDADSLRRDIESILYTHSLLPEFRGDVLNLLEKTDDVIDISKNVVEMLDIEKPVLPKEIEKNFLLLADISQMAIESVVSASRSFFRDVKTVKNTLHRVYYYEKEADVIAKEIKNIVFNQITNLELSNKIHLRDITNSTAKVSDKAEDVADILSILTIKRII